MSDREQTRRDAEAKLRAAEERGPIFAAIVRGDACCQVNDAAYSRDFWLRAMDRLAELEQAERERDERVSARQFADTRAHVVRLEAQLAAVPALVEAVKRWDATLSSWCDGTERDAVRETLAAWEQAQK